ncbi:MAG: hypothetical protein M3P04_13460 [Actinomycetota bacterium]|nr:hypothetical protein [Actinomycetota bacterium]
MTPLRAWFASRLGVALLVVAAAHGLHGFLAGWDSWDVTILREVAQWGYDGYPEHYADEDIAAFFPGFPLVLKAFHVLIPSWTAAGLVVSLVAGAVACVYLARLAELDDVDGGRAVLCLVLSPYAVFLAAGYSEALFLALVLPGWWAARRGHWAAASLLVAGACTVRISGLFLAIALVVQWLVTSRDRTVVAWLAAPFLTLLGYAAYLHHLTGDWMRWFHAQQHGWHRELAWPWTSFRTTWDAAFHGHYTPEYTWSFRAEIAAVLVGVVVTLVLLRRARWAEATYVGLSVAALATSSFYLSVARATLLWFPLWLLLAEAMGRRPWLQSAYVTVATPLMAAGVLTFTAGRWVG